MPPSTDRDEDKSEDERIDITISAEGSYATLELLTLNWISWSFG